MIKLIKSSQTVPKKPLELIFVPALKISTHSADEVPRIHFDQLAVIAHYHYAAQHHLTPLTKSKSDWDEIDYIMICQGIANYQFNPRIQRYFLQHQHN